MASEDVVGKRSESAVSTIVNLAEEAKIASEGVKAPTRLALLSICKSLVAGGVAGGVLVHSLSLSVLFMAIPFLSVYLCACYLIDSLICC